MNAGMIGTQSSQDIVVVAAKRDGIDLSVIDRHNPEVAPLSRISMTFEQDLIALVPGLRVFSHSLCRNSALAEDLAQEALTRAWRYRNRFESGTNLRAWVFTILRREFYSQMRRARHEAPWDDVLGERISAPAIEQEWAMELADCTRALRALPEDQGAAVVLIGAGGLTHDEAAKICMTNVGTVKSRASRGRASLSGLLAGDGRPMPPRSSAPERNAVEYILAELTALTAAGVGTVSRVRSPRILPGRNHARALAA
jgi:RNA polymerase sigma-70 factor, ECF subfamily